MPEKKIHEPTPSSMIRLYGTLLPLDIFKNGLSALITGLTPQLRGAFQEEAYDLENR